MFINHVEEVLISNWFRGVHMYNTSVVFQLFVHVEPSSILLAANQATWSDRVG